MVGSSARFTLRVLAIRSRSLIHQTTTDWTPFSRAIFPALRFLSLAAPAGETRAGISSIIFASRRRFLMWNLLLVPANYRPVLQPGTPSVTSSLLDKTAGSRLA